MRDAKNTRCARLWRALAIGTALVFPAACGVVYQSPSVRQATGGDYPVVSSVTATSSKWAFLQTRWHIVCVRIEGNRFGTVLKRAAGVADEFCPADQPETDAD